MLGVVSSIAITIPKNKFRDELFAIETGLVRRERRQGAYAQQRHKPKKDEPLSN